MKPIYVSRIAALVLLGLCAADADLLDSPYKPGPGLYPRWTAKDAEPGLTYGPDTSGQLPKTLLYSVTVDELAAEVEDWVEHGYGGFFLTGIAGEWSTDIWGVDGAPWTIGESDATFQKASGAVAKARALGADVFLTTAFSHPFEWFNDTAWQRIEHQFRQLAIFARDLGCTGLAIDIEYVWQQYHFVWEGYDYNGYTRAGLVKKIRDRMTNVATAMYDEFPGMVLLTLPESSMSLGSHIQAAWIEVAARRDAPGGVHLCTEYTYRRPNARFMLGHAWMNTELMHRQLSESAFAYWQRTGSIAEGIWVFGDDPEDYHGTPPSLAEFRQAFAASLMVGRKYNWIYSHNVRPWFLGRDREKYSSAEPLDGYIDVVRKREVISGAQYTATAASLRTLQLRDYGPDLGLAIVPTFAGPREELEVNLMPADVYQRSPIHRNRDTLFALGFEIYQGKEVDARDALHTQMDWLFAGPFPNADGEGHEKAYAPEVDPAKVEWQRFDAPTSQATVNLAGMYQPSDDVCAYALCYLRSDAKRDIQIRLGANDTWKLWLGSKLVADCHDVGRIVYDREILPLGIDQGVTPLLLKVCNQKKDWGFVLRICDTEGKPIEGLTVSTQP
ncbi:MAG: hypothetical protein HUU46_23495 [Candidatus Hydrogenedentes bacterium]|nr:hypothetical protein [Candidatus Hydrogenedentota bacterium]